MHQGEYVDLWREGQWQRCRVMVPMGSGAGNVFAVFRRLSDCKRVIWFKDGTESVVS